MEKVKYINYIKELIAREMSTLLQLTEDIYNVLEPYFMPKESKLVKFEIINYLLFRLFYDGILEVSNNMPLEYFNAFPEIFSNYISNPQSVFFQKEILRRNRMYVQIHYMVKYEEPEPYTNLSIILFTLVKYISTHMNEKKIRFPASLFQTEPVFPSDPVEKLGVEMEILINEAFKELKEFLFVALN